MTDQTQTPAAPLVVLVVLNWNGFADTDECLRSLRTVDYPNYRVLVVDNASSDASPAQLATAHPEIPIVRCAANHGIAAGYNRGIEAALAQGADYVMVMNNDLAVDPAFVSQMVAVQRNTPGCGIVMPKIFYYEARDIIWSAGGRTRPGMPATVLMRGRDAADGPEWRRTVPIELAPSCCLLLTRALCEQVRFDEHYFFYYDDWDFCVAARKAGFTLMFAADALLWHKVSRSTQNSIKSLRWWRILGQSCVRYHRKHFSTPTLAVSVAWVLLRETFKGNARSLPTYLAGVRDGLRARTIEDMRPGWSA